MEFREPDCKESQKGSRLPWRFHRGAAKRRAERERSVRKRLGVKTFRFRSINLDLDAGTFQINGQNLDLKSVTDFKLILGQMGWEIEVKQNALI